MEEHASGTGYTRRASTAQHRYADAAPAPAGLRSFAAPDLRALARAVVHAAQHPLTLLLLAFFCNALLWALIVPHDRTPDHWAHFDYVRHLAIHRTLPVYGQTTHINSTVLNSTTQHPPLYYLLATPVQLLAGDRTIPGQVTALRIFSIALSSITIGLTYLLGRRIVPERPEFGLVLAMLVAFNPMFTFISMAVSNDVLIMLIYAALLLLLWYGLEHQPVSRRWLAGLGALLGAGVLTKFAIVAGIVAAALLLLYLAWQQRGRRWRTLASYGMWVGGSGLLVSGWYILRNWRLYGDPSGVLVMDRFDVNLMIPYRQVGTFWEMLTTTRPHFVPFWEGIFHGFWGIFDFYVIWLAPRIYRTGDLLLLGGMLGAAVWAVHAWRRRAETPVRRRLILAGVGGIVAVMQLWSILNYSYTIDHQPQGRYLLPAVVPISLAILAGWEHLAGRVRMRRLVAPLLGALIVAINLLALFTAVAPVYHDRYLRTLIVETNTVAQPVYGAFEAHVDFVPQQAQIASLELLLDAPQEAGMPLVWRLRHADTGGDLATALGYPATDAIDQVTSQAGEHLTRTRIDLSHLRLIPGQAYTLALQVPRATADQPVGAYLPGDTAPADLGLQVVYPTGADRETLRRVDYLLRAAAPASRHAAGQRLLYPLVALLAAALVLRLFVGVFGRRRGSVSATVVLGVLLIGLAAPPDVVPRDMAISTHTTAALPGLPLALATDPEAPVADLILLSGSSLAHKHPADNPAQQQSLVQPYRFVIDGETRPVLAMQSPGAITYTLDIPAGAAFQSALALNPQVWQADMGDGAEFIVRVTPEGQHNSHELLRHSLVPQQRLADRGWHPLHIDLGDYANQRVELTLQVLPGPAGDTRYDWAGWAKPRIVR